MRSRAGIRTGRRDPRRGQRGFTLMELLITLAVSVIGMTGVMALQLATTRTNQGAANAAEAVTIAQRTLEEARSKTLTQMAVDYEGDAGSETEATDIDFDFNGETVLGRTVTFQRRIIVASLPASNDLIRVRVVVRWYDDGVDPDLDDPMFRHDVAVELLRTRQEAF